MHCRRWTPAAAILLCSIAVVPAMADVIYVHAAATGSNDGSTWSDAFTSLQSAIAVPSSGDEIWVAAATYRRWIEQLAEEGITAGCGGGSYCPGSPNTRGQMAVFLTKTFGLE